MELTEDQEKKVGTIMGTYVYVGALIGLVGTFAYLGVFKDKKKRIPKMLIGTGITMAAIFAGSAIGTSMVEKYKEELLEEEEED